MAACAFINVLLRYGPCQPPFRRARRERLLVALVGNSDMSGGILWDGFQFRQIAAPRARCFQRCHAVPAGSDDRIGITDKIEDAKRAGVLGYHELSGKAVYEGKVQH